MYEVLIDSSAKWFIGVIGIGNTRSYKYSLLQILALTNTRSYKYSLLQILTLTPPTDAEQWRRDLERHEAGGRRADRVECRHLRASTQGTGSYLSYL